MMSSSVCAWAGPDNEPQGRCYSGSQMKRTTHADRSLMAQAGRSIVTRTGVQTKTHGGFRPPCVLAISESRAYTCRRTIIRYSASRITAPRMDMIHPALWPAL